MLVSRLFTNWSFDAGYLSHSLHSLNGTPYQLLTCGLCVGLVGLCDRLFTRCETRPLKTHHRSVLAFVAEEKATVITLWLIAVAWLLLLSQNGVSTFVYFQF